MQNSTYIIGEIGQNHNGSVDIGKQIIDVMARPVKDDLFNTKLAKMDAIKFTKRDLKEELTKSANQKPYNSAHSFGKTYGEHRAFLELSDEEHFELYTYAKRLDFDFIETITAKGALSLLKLFIPDKLKVASRDLTNLPLLEALAEINVPIILSTGMGGIKELDDALNVITKYHSDISILHCLSEYPAHYRNINLNTIPYLIKHYPEYLIGYSDHSIGVAVPVAAVAMGAKIIEKHITLDRKMKGTDHSGSLGADGAWRLVRDIRNIDSALGVNDMFVSEAVLSTREKLERSIASKVDLEKNDMLREEHFQMLSPGTGLKWTERHQLIGKRAVKRILKDELICKNDVK